MATQIFTQSECAFGLFGYHDSLTNTAQRRWSGGLDGPHTWTGYITGTDATLHVLSNGAAGYVSVDGGAEVLVTSASLLVPLFAGLADAAHLVRVRGYYYTTTNSTGDFLTVTGADPAVGLGADLGTAYFVNDPDAPLHCSIFRVANLPSANIRPQLKETSFDNPASYARQGAIVIRAQCDSIWLYAGLSNSWLSIDGSRPEKLAFSETAVRARRWQKIASGLDSGAEHTYMIIPQRNTTGGAPLGVMINSAGTYGTPPVMKSVMQLGDSITRGENSATVPNASVDIYEVCAVNGWLPSAVGYTGKTTAEITADLASIMTGAPKVPEYVVSAIGHNDTTGAQFVTDYTAWLEALLALSGVEKIACRIIVPNNTLAANDIAQNADMLTAIAATGSSIIGRVGDENTWLHVSTVEGNGGVDGANPDALGLHPDVAGYHTLAGYETSAYKDFFNPAVSGRRRRGTIRFGIGFS